MTKQIEIIAETGMLHNGSVALAKALIKKAAQSGADVVKFQTHMADSETTKNAPSPTYFRKESRYNYFKRTEFSSREWRSLNLQCKKNRVEFLSSPFSIEAVELLESVGVTRYKVPSGEVTNLPMIREIAKTHKPILLSSGMSCWKEIDNAVNLVLKYHKKLVVMQCASEYPCALEHVGLNVMLTMKKRYGLEVGLSDHTMGNVAAFAAASLGASVIEKHFMLDRAMYGSDAKHSIKPQQFKELVSGIREIEMILNHPVNKNDVRSFESMKKIFEKSVVSLTDISKNSVISEKIIGIKKPGTGITPKFFKKVIGMRAARHISKDRVIAWKDLKR